MVIWEKNVNIFINKQNIVNVAAYIYRQTIKAYVYQISKHFDQK